MEGGEVRKEEEDWGGDEGLEDDRGASDGQGEGGSLLCGAVGSVLASVLM